MNDHRANSSDEGRVNPNALVAPPQTVPATRDPYLSAVGAYGAYGGYGAGAEATPEFQLDPRVYLRFLFKHRWVILSVVAAALVLGAVITLMKTPLYTSTVRLQIDRSVAKIVEGGNVTPEGDSDDSFMQTQFELLRGGMIAQRVASALKLGDDPNFFQPREFSIVGFFQKLIGFGGAPAGRQRNRTDLEGAAAGIVVGNRDVRPVRGARLVDVSYSDAEPARAQRIAAAYAEAFIASNLDKRFEANSYAKVFLEDQLKQLKLRLEQSEKVLLDFGQKEEIVQTNEKASIAENNLASANVALGALVSERIKNEQQWKQLEPASAINLPQLLSNAAIGALRARRSTLETEYQQKLEIFKPSYPAMVQLGNQIAEIDRELAAEVKTLKESYKAAYQSSLDQEMAMKKQIETLKLEALDLQKRSIQYNILKREVDSNRSLYDSLLQRFKQVDVAAGVGANNVFIVDKATLPGAPSSPNMSRALLNSLAFGLVAALGVAFLLERLDDTLRSPEEVLSELWDARLWALFRRSARA
jgi:polysaccharide biosynthesis transport protein